MRGAVIGVVLLVLGACAAPFPSPSPGGPSAAPQTATPSQAARPDTAAPPPEVQAALARSGVTLVRLTAAQLATIAVTREEAEQTALATRGSGYGPGDDYVTWQKVGCVFLGYYTGFHHPRQGYVPPTFPAYLVQVLADPIPDFPMLNFGVIVINATTGEQDTQYGGGDPPDGMIGTTCGVSP